MEDDDTESIEGERSAIGRCMVAVSDVSSRAFGRSWLRRSKTARHEASLRWLSPRALLDLSNGAHATAAPVNTCVVSALCYREGEG